MHIMKNRIKLNFNWYFPIFIKKGNIFGKIMHFLMKNQYLLITEQI